MHRVRPFLWFTVPLIALTGCQPSEVDTLRGLPMPMSGHQKTVEKAFADHPNCTQVEWKAFADRGSTKVKVTCEVKDLTSLRKHLKQLEKTADQQSFERFKIRKERSLHELQRSIEVLSQRIDIAKEKVISFEPLKSLPKQDLYRLNCDDYTSIAKSFERRIEKEKAEVDRACNTNANDYSAQTCSILKLQYRNESRQLRARIADAEHDKKACLKQRELDKAKLQAINEERVLRVKEAQARHDQLIASYQSELENKRQRLLQVESMTNDEDLSIERAVNQKLAGIHDVQSLHVNFIFRITQDKKEAILESVSSQFAWPGYRATPFIHQPSYPLNYDASDVVSAILNHWKLWDCENDQVLCRKQDSTIIPIYTVR